MRVIQTIANDAMIKNLACPSNQLNTIKMAAAAQFRASPASRGDQYHRAPVSPS
jgi:hypothetical protein